MRKLNNENGAILLITLLFVFAFSSLGIASIYYAGRQNEFTDRLQLSTKAFWLADGGVQRALALLPDTTLDPNDTNNSNIVFGDGTYNISSVNIAPAKWEVISEGFVNGEKRAIRAVIEGAQQSLFDDTIAAGGDIRFWDEVNPTDNNTINVDGKTRLSGDVIDDGSGNTDTYEDIQTGLPSSDTTISLPDVDGNGTANQLNDFVVHFQNLIATYPPGEIVHYQTNNQISIRPNDYPPETKIIFIEASVVHQDQIDLQFTDTWAGEMLTIVAVGEINYNHAMHLAGDTQLNMISYDDVDFEAPFGVDHKGVMVSIKEDVEFDNVGVGSFKGIVVAGDDINIEGDNQTIDFIYDQSVASSLNLPPGFEGFGLEIGIDPTIVNLKVVEWNEI